LGSPGAASTASSATPQPLSDCEARSTLGVLHLEEDATRTALGIVGYHLGARVDLNAEGIDREALRAAFAETVGRSGVFLYDAFGSTSVENILARIRYLAKAGRCGYVILDHLSIVVSGLAVTDERKAIDMAMTQLRTLAEECKIAIILVSHLSRGDGKDPEQGGAVSLKMIRGSQSIAQLSDTISSLERNQQADGEARNVTLWRVLKCRHTGCTGPMTKLLYDRKTGRLWEVPLSYGAQETTGDEFDHDTTAPASPADF
jgi:twinkle protein